MLLKFCLATIGVCVFRCADFGWRTFYFLFKGEKKMKKTISILLMICALTFCLVSCGHEHEWREPTYDTPKICADCGETEGASIKEMLMGDWKEEGSSSVAYVRISFTDDGFKGNLVMNGSASSGGAFSSEGIVEVSGNTVDLIYANGSKYASFTYTIDSDTISLTNKEGKKLIKIND